MCHWYINHKTLKYRFFSDSETVYDEILDEIFQKYDREYTDRIRLKFLGITEQDIAKIAVKELNLPLRSDEFLTIFRKKSFEKFDIVNLMPGAKQLIHHLDEHDIPRAIATSSAQNEMERKTKSQQDVFKLFHHIVCGSTDPDVKRGKPAPDIFLTCASRFPDKPHPSQVK